MTEPGKEAGPPHQNGGGESLLHFYDRQGKELDVTEWGHLSEDLTYRLVGYTLIRDWRVTTIWTGHDLNIIGAIFARLEGLKHIPVIFDTVIFPPGNPHAGIDSERWYATEDGAIQGHQETIQEVLAFLGATADEIRSPVVPGQVIRESVKEIEANKEP